MINPLFAMLGLSGGEVLLLLCAAVACFIVLIGGVVAIVWFFRRKNRVVPPAAPSPAPPKPAPAATVAMKECPQCHQLCAPDAPEGLCPQCLAKAAFGTEPTIPKSKSPPAPAELAAQFPQLEILGLLGRGGMGTVYKARQPRLDRIVALKILPIDSTSGASFAERFEREAKALAQLNHPGIVTLYDFGQTSQYYYFIMEYVDGMDLRQLLQARPVEPRQALELVTQICTALQFAHDENIVHRDIKPENILITKKGQVKIADFGLAKLLGAAPDTALTMSQAAMGTMNYMAPEQRENAQKVDHRADIYSLGVVFYELLTGEVPMGRFDAPSKKAQIDVRLDEVVLRALEREPERRYQHASDVKTNVETISATQPPPPPAVTTENSSPTFTKTVLATMIVPALLCVVLWFFARNLSYLCGLGLLSAGIPSSIFEWRRKLASRGLQWRQLPPEVRRRGNRRMTLLIIAGAAVITSGLVLFPSHTMEWREEWFYPKSHAYEKVGVSGNISSYQIPFWSDRTVGASGTMAIKIYRKESSPAMLTFSLPGLLVENNSHDPGQPVSVLNFGTLTNWLHDTAKLDVAPAPVQAEARQLMNLFDPYEDSAAPSWPKLHTNALETLRNFDVGGITVPFAEYGAFGLLGFALIGFPGVVLCVFYLLALPMLKRSYAEAQAEIDAGRWTPPKIPPAGFQESLKILIAFIPLVIAIEAGYRGDRTTMFLIFGSWAIVLTIAINLHSRQRIQAARKRGLWPDVGGLPTLEHVKRLAQAGEKILAIKLYRQLHPVSLSDAKAAVEKLTR